MKNLQDEYPILSQCTYLNTANHGLISKGLVAHRAQLVQKMQQDASLYTAKRHRFIQEAREVTAEFLGANSSLTAMVPNFSLAFNRLLDGLPRNWKFLLLKEDYPSINQAVEAAGFTCVYANINAQLEENIEEVCRSQNPQVLCLSVVQYISGIKIDLEFLKKLKAQFPSLLIIGDLTQYIGSEPFCFRESGIDIAIASCYKWLHAGDGNAFLCMKEGVPEWVLPSHQLEYYKNNPSEVSEMIDRFEPGHQDIIAFGSLEYAITQAQAIGMERIQERQQELGKQAQHEFEKRGLLSPAVTQRQKHSSIFNIQGGQALFQELLAHQVICSQRGPGIRISFSYVNRVEDLEILLDVLDKSVHATTF